MPSVMWKESTAEDLRALAAAEAVVVLPVASMEQHGPHLPVGVDTILCEAVCRRAAEIVAATGPSSDPDVLEPPPRPVVVAPTLWCGMAEHHMSFGGTFTFDIPTYRAVLLAFLKSIERAGFRRVAIVNGHGGNMSALNAFLPDLQRETHHRLYATTYFMLAVEQIAPLLDRQNGVRHACEVETSMMMALTPRLVKTDRLDEAHGPMFDDTRSVLAPDWQSFRAIADLSANGVIGDARTANAAKGSQLVEACAAALAAKLLDHELWGIG
ncbi:MAG: creatininase family protein [Beijerinckiaceae bacterium]